MRGFTSLFLLVAALACLVLANNSLHQQAAKYRNQRAVAATPLRTRDAPRKRETSTFLNSKSSKFAVNGTALPDVDFNIGESYAGLLPISSNKNDPNQLFFWFFPSQNPKAKKEIVIWLNGGPGCSSLDGLFQENGPFIWQSGTYEPVHNPYSYTNLTNVVYIDQPVSTGLSRGNKTVNNELDVAADFRGFWKNFVQTFGMQGYEVYIVGESYAGKYIPYIAAGFLDTNNTKYYNLKGIQVNDGVINSGDVTQYAPVFPALQYFQNVIRLNDTFMQQLSEQADRCGYTEFFDKYSYQFPPSGPFPPAPDSSRPGCDIYDDIYSAVYLVNPCFNIYHLTDYCPYVWDVMGFPSLGVGPNNYFNRSDVQAQLHIPPTNYFICGGGDNIFPNGDQSPEVYLSILPSVIERTNNVIVGHGLLDFLLFANGSLITIQNMTWNGHQGFQTAPSRTDNFFVPYHQSLDGILNEVNGADPYYTPEIDTAGAGFQGVTHTERGLTFVTVNLAGHEIPQYVPGAAYRQLEFLLGRIGSLEQQGDYTTQTGDYTGSTPLVRR